MQLQTILNQTQKIKSFVYNGVRLVQGDDEPEQKRGIKELISFAITLSLSETTWAKRGFPVLPDVQISLLSKRSEFMPMVGHSLSSPSILTKGKGFVSGNMLQETTICEHETGAVYPLPPHIY